MIYFYPSLFKFAVKKAAKVFLSCLIIRVLKQVLWR